MESIEPGKVEIDDGKVEITVNDKAGDARWPETRRVRASRGRQSNRT